MVFIIKKYINTENVSRETYINSINKMQLLL